MNNPLIVPISRKNNDIINIGKIIAQNYHAITGTIMMEIYFHSKED
jgi:hypothetical protein